MATTLETTNHAVLRQQRAEHFRKMTAAVTVEDDLERIGADIKTAEAELERVQKKIKALRATERNALTVLSLRERSRNFLAGNIPPEISIEIKRLNSLRRTALDEIETLGKRKRALIDEGTRATRWSIEASRIGAKTTEVNEQLRLATARVSELMKEMSRLTNRCKTEAWPELNSDNSNEGTGPWGENDDTQNS